MRKRNLYFVCDGDEELVDVVTGESIKEIIRNATEVLISDGHVDDDVEEYFSWKRGGEKGEYYLDVEDDATGFELSFELRRR